MDSRLDASFDVRPSAERTAEDLTPAAERTFSQTDPTTEFPSRAAPAVEVDVVIVAYHSRELVLACVDSLAASGDAVTLNVIVVDNGSDDGIVDAIGARSDDVRALQMGGNAGFSRANNHGIASGRADYVLILNPDTVVTGGAVEILTRFMADHPGAGVVAPRLINPDGADQQTARMFPTPAAAILGRRSPLTRMFPNNRWSARYLVGRDHPGDTPFEIDWVSGAAMMVPRRIIDEVGGFDEGFFLFWEDADWCRRIKASGYSVWCVPAARITHDEGGTRGHAWPPLAIRSFHAGAYRYWRKHHAPQLWNPLRWIGGFLLVCRASVLLGKHHLAPRRSQRQSGIS
jgi:N-acetylglucosaminyl-diphospho-decaprenol L-rhamnosyltransferase